jgi:aldehyde dehydrogenase (NAD+)
VVDESRDAMYEALWHDLRRDNTDNDLIDVDYSICEAQYALDHIHDWMKQEHMPTPLLMHPGHVRVRREPLGVTLITGAWNEPFMLTLAPLVAAIAAGNTAVLKPSEIAASAEVLAELCRSTSTGKPSPSRSAPFLRRPRCWSRSGT